jgi:leucyl-tRNA synthetase
MHLIYTRFFHKAGRDMGVMEGEEPMTQLRNQGMVLGEDGDKMSKSKGNVIAPDVIVRAVGADTVRAYLMFMARWELGAPWNTDGVGGPERWLKRVWNLMMDPAPSTSKPAKGIERELRRKVHQTLRSMTYDLDNFQFNTTVSSLMELLNFMYSARDQGAVGTSAWDEAVDIYLRMMAPITPHIAEEIWTSLGKEYSIHNQLWPKLDEEAAKDDEITLIVQVNGRLRDRITVPADISKADAETKALDSEAVQKYLEGKTPRKIIVVPKRLVNIVV